MLIKKIKLNNQNLLEMNNSKNNGVTFRHGALRTKQKITMAASHIEGNNTITVGVSVCNKKNPFDKQRGRVISSGRVNKNARVRNYVLDSTKTIKENIDSIFDDIQSKTKTDVISHFGMMRKPNTNQTA